MVKFTSLSLVLTAASVAEAVPLAATRRQRHSAVEEYFLNGDRNTIAVEVPVYFRHATAGLIAGHIDLLQVTDRKLQILDYKPDAARENPEKVVSQLSLYAEAISRRAKVPPGAIRCGYFDERDAYFFQPAAEPPAAERISRGGTKRRSRNATPPPGAAACRNSLITLDLRILPRGSHSTQRNME